MGTRADITAAIEAMLMLLAFAGKGGAATVSANTLIGQWAGDRLALSITARSARMELDCATGDFETPTNLDPGGRFSARGTLRLNHPGPTRADEPPVATAASYKGRLDGDRMTLDVVTAAPPGYRRYVLTRNARVKLIRCL